MSSVDQRFGRRTGNTGRSPGNNITHCPTCGCICKTVRSVQLTPTDRDVTFVCQNENCQHIFVSSISFMKTLQASRQETDGMMTPIEPEST